MSKKIPYTSLPENVKEAYLVLAREAVYPDLSPATPEKEERVKTKAPELYYQDVSGQMFYAYYRRFATAAKKDSEHVA